MTSSHGNNHSPYKPFVIRDEVHGDMAFDSIVRPIIDHRYFQRLRSIKQIGLAEYVFPCATHNRFQHSLGAAYLADSYFESVLNNWTQNPIQISALSEGTRLDTKQTTLLCERVVQHSVSKEFWTRATVLAALLHDVGHGPLSHAFEYFPVKYVFEKEVNELSGVVKLFLLQSEAVKSGQWMHEDISLLYVDRIFKDLEEVGELAPNERRALCLAVSGLIRKKIALDKHAPEFNAELEDALQKAGIEGGERFHRLLRPLISGVFDVDRLDYIQRDGRNCGVPAGGIEWRRIVDKVIPCLAHHTNDRGEPDDVVLLSNLRNQHVLDDFIFSLFQMYTQVYLHPKIVAMEHQIRKILTSKMGDLKPLTLTLEEHANLSDEGFFRLLKKEFQIEEVSQVLRREPGYRFRVASFSQGSGLAEEYRRRGYSPLPAQDRPMLKDMLGVFLYHAADGATGSKDTLVRPWGEVSPVAKQFRAISYAPEIWVWNG